MARQRWYWNGPFVETLCSNCSRERVMACTAPDGSTRQVCSKCQWDQQADTYANLIAFEARIAAHSVH